VSRDVADRVLADRELPALRGERREITVLIADIRNFTAMTARLPRDLHPVAWWVWALGLAAAASFTTNPYLLQAAVLVAGLDGIRNKRNPGQRLDINMYTEGHKAEGAKKLPLNLLDALRALEGSQVLREGLGQDVVGSYLKLKREDWNAYARHLTEWERQTTLDC